MAKLTFCFLVALAALGHFSEAYKWQTWNEAMDVDTLTWENCDGGKLPGTIKSLKVDGTVSIPGEVTLSMVLNTYVPLIEPVEISITAERELFGIWITLPCVDNIGTCTYNDVCHMLDQFFPNQCPAFLRNQGIPCHCPFKAGTYTLPTSTVPIPKIPLPSWLADGNYRVTGTLSVNNKLIGCAKFTFSMSNPSSWW